MQTILEQLPFNISLLILSPDNLKGLKQVKTLDIFEASSKDFAKEGLFSIDIFGKVGDERRNRLFGYMALNVGVLHPVIYKQIVDLKELYGKIMAGSAYAVFNPQTKDFDAATLANGETGYAFFMKHFDELVFEERKSDEREFGIKLVNKYRKNCVMTEFLVMPAGLRDFTIQPNGKPEEGEINTMYRQVLSIANVIGTHTIKSDQTHLDAMRYRLQLALVAIYDFIVSLLEGKSKLIQGWWTNRTVFNSTRNVITSNVSRPAIFDGPTAVSPNDTVVGLYQSLQAIFPLTVNLVRSIASNVFAGPNAPANLINKKTLLQESVRVKPEYYDDWMTPEGLESVVGQFESELLRHDTIEISGYYFALIYNDGKRVKLFHGLQDLPEGFDKECVHPASFAELLYLAIFEKIREIPCLVTRYPILGFGGIYPSMIYLKSTTRSQCLELLNEHWEPSGVFANEYPVAGIPFVESMCVANGHLDLLDADQLQYFGTINCI